MTDFPALAAHARQHGWPDEAAQRAVRERAGMLPEYDNEFEAERLMEQADKLPATNPGALVLLAEAQVRATLHAAKQTAALAEQQQAANLIAFAIVEEHGPFYAAMNEERVQLLATIRGRLGLA